MAQGWMNNKSLLRVTSLIVAVIIWLYVVITQDPPRTNRVDSVEIICGLNQFQLNEGLTIVSKSGDTVSFTASGKRSLVTGVKGSYYAKLNLDNITGPGKYNISPEISKPNDVSISAIDPLVIEVYVDKYVSSLLPVNIKTIGELPSGMVINKMTSELQQISVTLPSLALEQISYIGLSVDLSAVTNSVAVINCTPVLYDNNDNPMTMKNATIDKKSVAVSIVAEKTKLVNIKPILHSEGVDMAGIATEITPQTVEIIGDVSAVDTIQWLETQPLTLKDVPELNKDYKLDIVLPSGVRLKEGVIEETIIQFKK